jgi:hypothetical protein
MKSSIIFTFTKHYYDNQIKDDEMIRAYGTHGERGNFTELYVGLGGYKEFHLLGYNAV